MGFNQNFSGALETLIADLKPSGVNSISVNGISPNFSCLKIIGNLRSDIAGTSGDIFRLRFNNDSGANYADQNISATGANVIAGTDLTATGIAMFVAPSAGSFPNSPASFEATIPFYSDSSFIKFSFCNAINNATAAAGPSIWASGGFWNNTNAINSITFYLASGNFVAGSHIKIYGVS